LATQKDQDRPQPYRPKPYRPQRYRPQNIQLIFWRHRDDTARFCIVRMVNLNVKEAYMFPLVQQRQMSGQVFLKTADILLPILPPQYRSPISLLVASLVNPK